MRQIGVSGAYLRNHCLGITRAAQIKLTFHLYRFVENGILNYRVIRKIWAMLPKASLRQHFVVHT
jgi:hypothetical protein